MDVLHHAKKMDEEELKDVNGGYLYFNWRSGLWNVLDGRTGKVVAEFETKNA